MGPEVDNTLDYQYCVRTPDYVDKLSSAAVTVSPTIKPTGATNTASAPTGGVTAPAPTQSGQPTNCIRWHVAKTGDSCSSIENDAPVKEPRHLPGLHFRLMG